jgi:hypothetical protein
MATTQTGGIEEATCPLCDDYRGPPSSVEAHISRKTDPVHQGEVGRAHRDDLQRQVAEGPSIEEEDVVELPVPEEEDESEETGGDAGEEELPDQWQPDEQDDDQDDLAEHVREVRFEDDARDDQEEIVEDDQEEIVVDEETESSGIPLPVPKEVLLIGAIVVFGAYLYTQMDTSGSPSENEEREEGGIEDVLDGYEGGLIEG